MSEMTFRPQGKEIVTDLESEYSLLLARNNVLSERVSELEAERDDWRLEAEKTIWMRRMIKELQAKLARVEKLPRFEMNVSYPSMHRVSTVGHHATPKGEWVRYADIKQALEQDDEEH